MSRIGKLPIEIPENVTIKIDGSVLNASGPKGDLSHKIPAKIKISEEDKKIVVSSRDESREASELFGLTRTLVSNMVKGVSDGYEKKLEFHGVGYRASVEGKNLVMSLGFSHPIKYIPRDGVEIKVEKNTIIVSGIDKQLVGQTAAEIREFKKPEPYKGKGIRYEGERIRRKAGKAATKGCS